jgi:hypothetical protein
VWVPELHADRERFHVHFAVGQFVQRKLIERAWGHGFVHIKLLGDLPIGSGRLGEARVAARYLSKYVGKAIDAESLGRPLGLHRYEVAQGFQPLNELLTGRTAGDVTHAASERMGSEPTFSWNSDEVDDWRGAPALWLQWTR